MRIGRVRTRAGFAALAGGRRARHGALRVTAVLAGAADDRPDRPEVGYAVGRSVGSAVVRNRVRRRLRAAVAELGPARGTYVVAATPAAAAHDYRRLRDDLAAALSEVGALQPVPGPR